MTLADDSRTLRFVTESAHPPKIRFLTAKVSGELYVRTREPSERVDFPPALQQAQGCTSEQIHVTLGDKVGVAIISFASPDPSTPSSVQYSFDENAFSQGGKMLTATGVRESYSNLNSVNSRLYAPSIGMASESYNYILSLQNTSSWAYDKKTGERWDNWYGYKSVQLGLGDYNNPYMIYDSPVLHTVTITGITPGLTVYYTVAGDCTVRSFVYPRNIETAGLKVYPFTIGLTGDLGQTNVSVASLAALAAMNPAFAVIVGDLP
jgi:hypothetical protein